MSFEEWWADYLRHHPIEQPGLRRYTKSIAELAWHAGQDQKVKDHETDRRPIL